MSIKRISNKFQAKLSNSIVKKLWKCVSINSNVTFKNKYRKRSLNN